MTSCDKVQSLYSLHLEGEASPAEAARLEEHLSACPACRGDYAAFLAATGAVRALPRLDASPGFEDRVLARIRAASRRRPDAAEDPVEVSLEPRGWTRWIPRLAGGDSLADTWAPRLALAGVVAVLAVIVTLSVTLHRGGAPGSRIPALAGGQPVAATGAAPRTADGITDLRDLIPDLPPELTAATQPLGGESYVMDRMVIRPGSSAGGVRMVTPVDAEAGRPVYVTF